MSQIPTAEERLAAAHASMKATIAAGGKNVKGSGSTAAPGHVAPGAGCLRTDDSTRRMQEMDAYKASIPANVLTPAEIINADRTGRTAAREAGVIDSTELSAAGAKGVNAAVAAKLGAK